MQITKSRNILKKINTVFQNMIEDKEAISPLEKELLKSYVIQFYDSIIDETESADIQPTREKFVEEVKEPPSPTIKFVEEETPSDKHEAEIKPAPSQPSAVEKEEETKTQPLTPAGKSVEKGEDLLASIFAEIEREQSNSHIGERLISDLKKTMGLNDKLLYANKLFDGNQSQLLDTLDQLNRATDLETVKPQLNGLAQKNNWLDDDKRKPVTEFVRLVVRKFNTVS